MQKVEFFKHNIGAREIRDVTRVLKGLFLTTGKHVDQFEKAFAQYLGLPHAVGVTSCTAAIQLSLHALGIGQGDEVITTPMSYVATTTAILQAGASPVFVDVEPDTGNLNAELLEGALTPRTRAILPVHLYGQMCDMKRLRTVADRHGLAVIEDAAHALEASRDGVRVGALGEAACFSFYPTKSITCGEGGAVAMHRKDLARSLKSLRHHGMNKTAADRYQKDDVTYEVTMMGWKYNMDNIQAALLTVQLKRVEEFLRKRSRIAERYRKGLADVPGIRLMTVRPETRHSHHLFPILVPPGKRVEFIKRIKARGIGVSLNYIPIHRHKYFQEKYGYQKGMFPSCEAIGDSTVSLPVYPKLRKSEVDYVISAVRKIAAELNF